MDEKNPTDNKRSTRLPRHSANGDSPPRASHDLHGISENIPELTRGTVHNPRASTIINMPEEPANTDIYCCGVRSNPRFVSFFTKTTISILILGFCFLKLWNQPQCSCSDETAVYVSILSSVLSFFIGHQSAK
jgi:hypothetical protein